MPRNAYIDHVLDLLKPLGRLTTRRIFGAEGIYRNGLFFGFVEGDSLYFKTDEITRGDYEGRGSEPFRITMRGKTMEMSYWRVPEEVMEDGDELMVFANTALDVARAAKKDKAPKAKKKTAAKTAKKSAPKKPAKKKIAKSAKKKTARKSTRR